jgi:hypothetical protein
MTQPQRRQLGRQLNVCSDATERLIVLGNILLLSFPFHFVLFSLEWPIWQHSCIAFLMWTGLGYGADKGLKVEEG